MKKFLPLFLILALLCCGCAAKQEDPNVSKTQILPEVISAYEIDDTKESQIEDLFSDLSDAFEALASKNSVSDDDFYNYANKVSNRLDLFQDTFDWAAAKSNLKTSSGEEKNQIALVMAGEAGLSTAQIKLTSALSDKLLGTGSGERCAEAAVNAVNAYAQFFCGEDCITDEDLDRVG